QKKKVLISFYLACNTSLLLMDEPTNGLDIVSKGQFRKIMTEVINEDRCIIISTHQVKDLEMLIDRITILHSGEILFNQKIEEISEKLVFKYASDRSELASAIYAEPSLRGNVVVAPNEEGVPSQIDMEMLYKTVLQHKKTIQSLFSKTA